MTEAVAEPSATSGVLQPVTTSSYGAGKLVSVLVSVWTPEPPKPLLHTQLELEASVGIGQEFWLFQKPITPLLPPHHQRHTAS
jgi:hypothetical protein